MRITTWNVNSVRARLPLLLDFLNEVKPVVLLLQETKCENHKFPIEELNELGYNVSLNGQKAYNGVAIASKFAIEAVKVSFENNPKEEHARFIEAEIKLPIGFARFISVYVINGGEVDSKAYHEKLSFLEHLSQYFESICKNDELLFIGGDFNVAPEEIDTCEPKGSYTCFTMPERTKMRALINKGLCDLYRDCNADQQEFSWWGYRERGLQNNRGMRLDMLLSSYKATRYVKDCKIQKEWRLKEKASDHAPVTLELQPCESAILCLPN
jgi:exodeoxyribonuclease III